MQDGWAQLSAEASEDASKNLTVIPDAQVRLLQGRSSLTQLNGRFWVQVQQNKP